jgi:uncharacterized protein (TIGR00303 family)
MDRSGAGSADRPRFVLVAGSTATATIDGISAAGVDADLLWHTPSADAELLVYGGTVRTPAVPVSPTGCPTPAVVTRAVRERRWFPVTVVDAGLAKPTAAPTLASSATPGGDVRDPEPAPGGAEAFARAREFGRSLSRVASRSDAGIVVGETIPGGTTTAMGVLAVLGEREAVSSSLPTNPLDRKREAVETGLDASGIDRGGAAGDPERALRLMGDPVLATVAGLAIGAAERDRSVTLAGGTQMLAATALVRHAGVDVPVEVSTTSYVAEDASAAFAETARDLGVETTVTDPGFGSGDHSALARFAAGEAKEGVGMGGALALADRAAVPMARIREQARTVYERLDLGEGTDEPARTDRSDDRRQRQ